MCRFALCIAMLVATITWPSCRRASPPDPNNEPPFGVVAWPPSGATVGREVEFTGWALDDSRVEEVRIYVDGQYTQSAKLKIPRPDVTKAYPKYAVPKDIHGWWELVDLGEKGGRREILAQAVDDQGAARDIGSVSVQVIER